jgi:hypothetical protein
MTPLRVLPLLAWLLVTGLLLAEAVIALGFGYRIASYPENHIGYSPYLALVVALPGAGVGLVALFGRRFGAPRLRAAGAALLAASLALALLVVALDRFNILTDYETWLQRGMPPRPF